jgi:hypothetical protein
LGSKFLIDECLSPDLATLARQRGFSESAHVTWLGKAGWKDWQLKPFILDQDWTFVTRNSSDFRGPAEEPGSRGQYAGVTLHAGLVCINGPEKMRADDEAEMFGIVLDAMESGDLVNQGLEITLSDDGDFELVRYALPNEADTGGDV